MRTLVSAALVLTIAAATAAGDREGRPPLPPARAGSEPHPGTASLPRFALFGWVSPPAEFATAERYAELAAAGLNTTVLAWEDPGLEATNRQRLAFSAAVGVKNLLLDNRLDHVHESDSGSFATLDSIVAAYRDEPAFLGYYLGDEPTEATFPRLAEWFRLLRERDPLHPGWNNLVGRIGFSTHAAFIEHLRRYASEVRPAVLSTDHYDHFVNGERGQFIENAAGTAQVAREFGLPFWGIVLVTKHGPFRAMNDGLLSWQVAQWLSYGARGIGYFTYWTPAPDPDLNWGDGMIRWGTGERSPQFERVRSLNRLVRPVGEALAGLTWLGTEHTGGEPTGGTAFAPDSLLAAVEGRATLGQFASPQGVPHLFVANRDSVFERTIVLDLVGGREAERLEESGAWSPWPSAQSAAGARVALTLPPGGFALLRLHGGCDALVSGQCRASLLVAPEPATGSVRFTAQRVSGGASLTIVDANGRRVWQRPVAGEAPALVWDGRAESGERVRPGIYWARLEDARGAVVRRLTWLGHR